MTWTPEQDEFLRVNYGRMKPADIALHVGKTSKAVINRRYRLGFDVSLRKWTDEEIAQLTRAYQSAKCSEDIDIKGLMASLGRTHAAITVKAGKLGLTDIGRPMKKSPKGKRKPKFESSAALANYRSARQSEWLKNNPHPRGALGKKHTEEAKAKMAEASRRNNAARTEEDLARMNLKAAKTKMANGTYAPARMGTTWKAGWREIGGVRKFYRSRWEANYARYLEWLKQKAQIADWRHEPKTFWFEGIKRGSVSYLPDFWVLENNGGDSFHEVKGWMDERSKTKIKRMAKYYPNVKLVVIREKDYEEIRRKLSSLIEGWE